MKIIDTHSHIYSSEFDADRDEVIERAKEAGVRKILLPNVDLESIAPLHQLVDKYPDYCIPMMGLHPTSVTADWQDTLTTIKAMFAMRQYVAVGEIGIDLYWDQTYQQEQTEAFEEQLQWSIEYDLPVAIHSRHSINECIASVKKVGADKLRGVFHSFSYSVEDMNNILSLGNFMLGINGVVTFKNSDLRDVLKHTTLSHIIVETDAPYLPPVPYRGKRNEPSYTQLIIEKLSTIYDISPEEIGEITSKNAKRLFLLKD